MVDPLSAFGLASNIISFIDFGCNLISETREIHRSGVSAQYVDLQVVAQCLSELSGALQAPSTSAKSSPTPIGTNALTRVAISCKEVADELLTTLEELKMGKKSHRKWQCFRQALATVWKKDQIEAFQGRLDNLRSQLNLQIVFITK